MDAANAAAAVTAACTAAGVLAALAAAAGLIARHQRRARRRAEARGDALAERLLDLEAEHEQLGRTAVTDPLTGIWNYRYLQLALEREISRAVRARRPLALLLVDLDGFRRVNEAAGHQQGNAVLRDLAQRLGLEIRQADILGRFGGEEFLAILPETDLDGAAHVAERLCWTVRNHPVGAGVEGIEPQPRPGRRGVLTASIGVAVLPDHGSHAVPLLRAADRALAEAKEAGGDGWRDALPESPEDVKQSEEVSEVPEENPSRNAQFTETPASR
ncbi:hypothetical protein BIV57_14925 [Mangrovactinospora gilvigrisea]|uniref:GGDEF domain-containing protein n=1 Tax=Mangrovactinospora gilvigrisea TaxID=1428644 RepID=A0A1J7C532_9ACTN|nr:GGDEF domain-containing protein [Mangrovactinospora gilvigrisea]OIV36664.1 hypothetical protein BIV57_14925 [Mangrovactinospora gilvigrisea]